MLNKDLSSGNQNFSETPSLWEFVRLNDYRLPKVSGASAARLKWVSFKRFFLRLETEELAPLKKESELQPLSQEHLDRVVKEIDWGRAVDAFDRAIDKEEWISTADNSVKFVVGPPYSGHCRMLTAWASRHGAHVVAPPSLEQILGSCSAWFKDWPEPGRLWVLPHLESCYLRHAQGLKLMRRLFEMVLRGELGNGVIGCDSWAWIYLQRIWPLPEWDVLTVQGFDGARLSRLFFHLAVDNEGESVLFRNAGNGKIIALEASDAEHEISPELSQLAVYCRGNVGLARMYWRERLKAEPESERQHGKSEQEQNPPRLAQDAAERCVWVADMPKEPVLPSEKAEDMAFIMHVLLLHNGLPEAVLTQLLPLPHHRIMSLLLRLKDMGIVALRHDYWQITPLGYISVRDYLRSRDYMLDAF
ncbi:hypothetical protein [Methylomarinum vadi]|uniref:hypothetical protein n=1 Tax=Methylomarinum vadi TaxID=438855 RepID=UPI0004DEE27F|nr:hypothetical protein [Methylomarinum vadi]